MRAGVTTAQRNGFGFFEVSAGLCRERGPKKAATVALALFHLVTRKKDDSQGGNRRPKREKIRMTEPISQNIVKG